MADRYQIALSRLRGMNVKVAEAILAVSGSEQEYFATPASVLAARLRLRGPLVDEASRIRALEEADAEIQWMTANPAVNAIYFTDSRYPRRLLECDDAPVLLYSIGSANLNATHVVAIVGTRNCTHYGASFINQLVDDLAQRLDSLLVVSGLAVGCDVTAHKQAMDCGISTVGVMAHGLDTIYPADHRNVALRMVREGGALISDYPHSTRINRGNFLARNRIVAGMCDCLVVAESAADRGGALHTARLASLYNRDVFALPGRTSDHYSGGCNKLIRTNVAHLVTCADDIIDTMRWTARPKPGTQQTLLFDISPEQQLVIDHLRHHGDTPINSLVAATGIPVGQLMALMVDLEFHGMVTALPGASYRLC